MREPHHESARRAGEPTANGPGATRTRAARAAVWIRARLAWRHAQLAIVIAAVLSSLQVLGVSLDSDDHFQVAALEHNRNLPGLDRPAWDLYSYARDRASNLLLRDQGVWAWWSDPNALMRLFRPLTSLTRWLDHALWPESLPCMQLHSLIWFALLLASTAWVYRRLCAAPWIASLTLMLFAFDEARAATLGWLCNRNALVSLTFGFAAIAAHDRWRSEGDKRAAWLAPACLTVGLLGGETALQACAYLFSYALFLDRGSRSARLASLLPAAAVVLAWAVLYSTLGFGARGSGIYIDPIREPLALMRVLPERLLLYALALFGGFSADWSNILPLVGIHPRPYILAAALVFVALLLVAFAPLYRRDARVRFWALGALLATLPACCVTASDRMLTGAALGGMALLASFLASLFATEDEPKGRPRWLVAFGCVLVFLNLILPLALRPFLLAMMDDFEEVLAHVDPSLPRGPEVRAQTVVLLNPPYDGFGVFFPLFRETHHIPRPARFRWLATGVSSLRVERIDLHTLQVTPSAGFWSNASQLMLRSLDHKLPLGATVRLTGATFTVASLTGDGRPYDVLVRFDEPLESPSLRFFQWGTQAYVPFQPPPVGAFVTLPAVDVAAALTPHPRAEVEGLARPR